MIYPCTIGKILLIKSVCPRKDTQKLSSAGSKNQLSGLSPRPQSGNGKVAYEGNQTNHKSIYKTQAMY